MSEKRENRTRAQLRQLEEREMMKEGICPVFFACPEMDVGEFHKRAIDFFLNSPTFQDKLAEIKEYPEFISKNLYPEYRARTTLITIDGNIFLLYTEGMCVTHELQDEMPDYADDDIEFVPPRTIIIDLSCDLSGQELSASVETHELLDAQFPRNTYKIVVIISSNQQSQMIEVLIGLNHLDDFDGDDKIRMSNIIIQETGIDTSEECCDEIVSLAKILNNEDANRLLEDLSNDEYYEIGGSILFHNVEKISKIEELD